VIETKIDWRGGVKRTEEETGEEKEELRQKEDKGSCLSKGKEQNKPGERDLVNRGAKMEI